LQSYHFLVVEGGHVSSIEHELLFTSCDIPNTHTRPTASTHYEVIHGVIQYGADTTLMAVGPATNEQDKIGLVTIFSELSFPNYLDLVYLHQL